MRLEQLGLAASLLRRQLPGIAAGVRRVLCLQLELDEPAAEAFDLLFHFRTDIVCRHARTQSPGRSDSLKTRDPGTEDKHIGRLHRTRRRGEEREELR